MGRLHVFVGGSMLFGGLVAADRVLYWRGELIRAQSEAPPMVSVVYARETMAPGQLVTDADLEVREIEVGFAPDGVAHRPEELIGRIVRSRLLPDEPVRLDRVMVDRVNPPVGRTALEIPTIVPEPLFAQNYVDVIVMNVEPLEAHTIARGLRVVAVSEDAVIVDASVDLAYQVHTATEHGAAFYVVQVGDVEATGIGENGPQALIYPEPAVTCFEFQGPVRERTMAPGHEPRPEPVAPPPHVIACPTLSRELIARRWDREPPHPGSLPTEPIVHDCGDCDHAPVGVKPVAWSASGPPELDWTRR